MESFNWRLKFERLSAVLCMTDQLPVQLYYIIILKPSQLFN